jgi:chemotaxis protein methyltransferase CheR
MHLPPETFDELRKLIRELCGVALTADKAYLIRHRLSPVLEAANLKSFEELVAKLRQQDAALSSAVVGAITTQETSFFRDGHPWDALRRQILPDYLFRRGTGTGRPLRIWSAATATGQEAYSLGMLLVELIGDRGGRPAAEIVATDIATDALRSAESAEFARRDVARGLTAAQIGRFFDVCPAGYRVREPVRKLINFRRFNLIEPLGSLGLFEIVLCRNVLIYFDEPTRRSIIERIREQIVPGGWLMLGAAENLYGVSEAFESVHMEHSIVYRRL